MSQVKRQDKIPEEPSEVGTGRVPERVQGNTHKEGSGIFLVFQWLRLCVSSEGSMGLIPDQGTNISHGM